MARRLDRRRSTIQLRTRNDLQELLANRESPAWRVRLGAEHQITCVHVVNWNGTERIEGLFDADRSRRRVNGRLVIAFREARIVPCNVRRFTRNPVRYL